MDRHQELETILGALESQIREATEESVHMDILKAERLYYSKELLRYRSSDIMAWMDTHLGDITNVINDLSLVFAGYNVARIAELSEKLRDMASRQAAYANELLTCKDALNG